VWEFMAAGMSRRWRHGEVTVADLQELRRLSAASGGWADYDQVPTVIPGRHRGDGGGHPSGPSRRPPRRMTTASARRPWTG